MSAQQIQSVAIVGAGAMGAMYAEHFARAGIATSLVASGARAARLRGSGLSVNGVPLRASIITPIDAASAPVDLVLVAVKHHDLATALADTAPFVGPGTTFISVLNGLDSEHVIAERFGGERVLLCIALGMAAGREGIEITYGSPGHLVIGTSLHLASRDRLTAVQEVLDRSGLVWETPEDMSHEMWWKFMVNTAVNQASAVLREPYAAFLRDGPARSLMNALIDEVIAVSQAQATPLGQADRDRWDEVLRGLPGDGRTSMLQDVDAGRPTEVGLFADRVVALGRQQGVPTPYNQAMSWILS